MASSHERQRPQLNVDMSLQPSTEDEPTIRMNVISKKRRLRYALMEESSDDDEEDDSKLETQQSAGQEPFEGNYQLSVPYPAKNQEEQFVLPPSEHGSSSSESDSDEEEENFVNRPPQRQQHESARLMQPPVREYANEEDLFDAAFVAPENRFLRQHAREEQNVQHDHGLLSRNHHSFRQHPPQPQYTTEPQVFDLCASDEEQTVDFTAEHQATFFGVQRHEKSPRFNANSRHVFSPHAAPAAARRPSTKAAPTTTTNDDDIVECWSSEDEEGNTKPRARRVTNDEPWNRRPKNTTGSFAASRNHAAAPRASSTFHASNDNDDDFDRMPAPSRQKNVLNQYKADRTAADRRNGRRLRDATTGMHSAASIPFPRKDLQGGSGVGLGGYTLGHQSFQQSFQQAVAPVATGRKQKAATKKGGKKRGGGGGKRNYYRKRGGGKKSKKSSSTSSSRGGGGGGRGRSRSKRGAGSNEEYSRKDPLLKNVGGASIIF